MHQHFLFENIDQRQTERCSHSRFTIPSSSASSSSSVPPRNEHPFRRIRGSCLHRHWSGHLFLSFLFSVCHIACVKWMVAAFKTSFYVSWQHSAQHRLSLPHTGADGSSGLRQAGADPPAVSGLLWILWLRVSEQPRTRLKLLLYHCISVTLLHHQPATSLLQIVFRNFRHFFGIIRHFYLWNILEK